MAVPEPQYNREVKEKPQPSAEPRDRPDPDIAHTALLRRLQRQPAVDCGRWRREELYEDSN